ncbi:MAG: hypothetical protein II567_00790 [Candidatus Riflebacteria bacterium]|nr:hypothetical protein [Candidatus Riflebacteria bacterium]
MKKKLTILLTVLLLLTCVPAQSNAGALFDKVSNAVSKIHQKVDSAFSKVKAKFTKSDNKKAEETKKENASLLSKARSVLQDSFNMNFLSSVPVIFWKKTFDRMFDYTQSSIDNLNMEHNGELITRDDFQDDKALHVKKSAELALHIKSLFGSSVFAYGVTLAVGGIKELIDSSFLNPNGGRCWEDFYADMVGASAVFGEKAFDKKLNKYMDSFLKENRKVDMVDGNTSNGTSESVVPNDVIAPAPSAKVVEVPAGNIDDSEAEINQKKQRLTEEYYEAVNKGDSLKAQRIAEQLRNLK